MKDKRPNIEQNEAYLALFDFLNDTLFNGDLQRPMLCLTRNHQIIGGYFSPERWEDSEGNKLHELSINANHMANKDTIYLINVLAHEMVHLWQHQEGTPGREGYHNKEYATKAREIGLQTIDSKTGKDVGDSITTEILHDSPLALCIADIPDDALFPWYALTLNLGDGGGGGEGEGGDEKDGEGEQGAPQPQPQGHQPRRGKRSRYTCPLCSLNCWAKPGARFICGVCPDRPAMVENNFDQNGD